MSFVVECCHDVFQCHAFVFVFDFALVLVLTLERKYCLDPSIAFLRCLNKFCPHYLLYIVVLFCFDVDLM